jgi:hypothetical protein
LKDGPVWATGTLNMLHWHKSFPPASFRLPLLHPARQHHFVSTLSNDCHPTALSTTGNAEIKSQSPMSFSEQFGSTFYPLNGLERVQTAGNHADVMQITSHAKFPGSDNQSVQPSTRDESTSTPLVSQPCLQILGKNSFMCIYNECGSRFTRISDLKRHHLDRHARHVIFYCRFTDCQRAVRGFSRKDKRNDHEKRVHCRDGQ